MESDPLLFIIIGILVLAAAIGAICYFLSQRKPSGPTAEDFQEKKRALKPFCSEAEYQAFMDFLFQYEGGFSKKMRDGSIKRDYLGSEKGDLKGIFYHVIVPNPNLHTQQKEEFRQYIRSIGVNGLEQRPDYETRDSALKNKETNTNDRMRKEVGNIGEQIVRDILQKLEEYQYAVINGAKLKYSGIIREYDHIAVGRGGIFILETKAFGMTDGKAIKAALFIDAGDHWILRKNHTNHELISPTEQITSEAEHFSQIISAFPFPVHPIVVLSNTEIFLKQNIALPYQVVRADQVIETVRTIHDHLTDNDVAAIVHAIDESRVN